MFSFLKKKKKEIVSFCSVKSGGVKHPFLHWWHYMWKQEFRERDKIRPTGDKLWDGTQYLRDWALVRSFSLLHEVLGTTKHIWNISTQMHTAWGTKKEVPEALPQSQSCNIIGIRQTWWEEARGWGVTMGGCRIFSWRTMTAVVINSQPTLNLCKICYATWMHIRHRTWWHSNQDTQSWLVSSWDNYLSKVLGIWKGTRWLEAGKTCSNFQEGQ